MSGGDSTGHRKTAEKLLRQIRTEPEHMAVLEYARAEGFEHDSAVFFLVAMLKVFAFAYDRMIGVIERPRPAPTACSPRRGRPRPGSIRC